MNLRRPKVITTDFRPPTAGNPPPLERDTARPGAAASPHQIMLAGVSDCVIAGIIADAEKRNLSNLRDHETRWWSERSSHARAIRRERKAAGTWTIPTRRKAA